MATTKEFVEPEETQFHDIPDPLVSEPARERQYTSGNVHLDPNQASTPIEEPSFMPPPPEQTKEPDPKTKKEPVKPLNPEMNDMSNKEKEMASQYISDLVFHNYALLKSWANKSIMIPEKKLEKLQMEGKVDLGLMVPYGAGKHAPALDIFRAFNREVEGTITMTPEFRERLEPILIRILKKHGIGMTDEQAALFIVGQDLVQTGVIAFQAQKQKNELIKGIKELTEAIRKTGQAPIAPANVVNPAAEATVTAKTEEQPKTTIVQVETPATAFDQINEEKAQRHISNQHKPNKSRTGPSKNRIRNNKGTGKRGRPTKNKNIDTSSIEEITPES